MIESFKRFWDEVGNNKRYWIPVVFFTISTYGFSVFSRTISIDDLASDYYIGSNHAMIGAGRWGMNVWHKLAAIPIESPASDRLLATTFLVVAGILLASLFFYIQHDQKQSVEKYTILTCCLITYPIIGEIWEYTGANYISTGGMLLSVISCYYLLTRKTMRAKHLLFAGVSMTLPMSSYESGVAFYITLVCAVLFYRYCIRCEKKQWSNYWKNAALFAVPLVFALCFRLLIGNFLRWLLHVPKMISGEAVIIWGIDTVSNILRKLFVETLLNYGINGFVYLPITVFALSAFFLTLYIMCLAITKRNVMVIIGGLLLVLSVFSLSAVQGSLMFYRTAIAISIFASFSMYCFMELFENKKKIGKRVVSILLLYAIWIQSAFLNSELGLNNQRSENEMRVMSTVAHQILTVGTEKPVVFVGHYDMGDYIERTKTSYDGSAAGRLYDRSIERLRNAYGDYYPFFTHWTEFPTTNINSVINWAMVLTGMMERYLGYLGYDIQVIDMGVDKEIVLKAREIVKNTQMQSYDIMETDDYIIATLQLDKSMS